MGGLSGRRIFAPTLPTRPRVPDVPFRRRIFEAEGREIRPLAGPEIPIPPEQDIALLERYDTWRAIYAGSVPEFLVFEFLTIQKKQIVNQDFYFQSPFFGGRTRFGGVIADFAFPIRREIWMVQGERFHLEHPQDRAKTLVAKAQFSSRGFQVIELWAEDLLTRPQFVLALAWERSLSVIQGAS